MRVVVTGAKGQLGQNVCRRLGSSAIPWDLPEFDITDRELVLREMRALRPDAIVNCAAYTNVDKAEQEVQRCQAVNAEALRYLVAAASGADCPLLHISTDYVFGGDPTRRTPYLESDPPAPQGVYATSKLAGERFALAWPKSCVVRTCGLYAFGAPGTNFVATMLRVGQQHARVRVVYDQYCTPTYVPHLGEALQFLLRTKANGLYHVVNSGQTNWFQFAKEVFHLAGMAVDVLPIASSEWPAAAPRPGYSALDTSKYHALGGPVMPAWQDGLADYFRARSQTAPRVKAE